MSWNCFRLTACFLLVALALSVNLNVCLAKEAKPESAQSSESSEHPYPLAVQGPKPKPIDPPTEEAILEGITRGVDYLVKNQRKNGAWGGPQRTKSLNIYAPVPGAHLAFRMGATSLAVNSLCEARELYTGDRRQEIEAALDKALKWYLDQGDDLRRADGTAIYNVWGHAYACYALVKLHERAVGDEELQTKIKNLVEYQVDRLKRYTFINGGWGYYDFDHHTRVPAGSPTSFTTATCLLGLREAEKLEVKYPEKLAKKAVDSILRQRLPDFSYAYGEYLMMMPRYDINRPAGSLGRSQACNLALRKYGREEITDEVLKTWLDRLYARNGWLSIGRKYPVPHESHFGVAGYFYYYGHFYAAMCIDELPLEERPHFQSHLAHILLPLQEKDGSWWDYPLYDYHYAAGTGMAVSSLLRCQKTAE